MLSLPVQASRNEAHGSGVTCGPRLVRRGGKEGGEAGGWERVPHSACNDALRMGRVALLFLSRGELHHERLWEAWLASAEGALPLQAVQV